MEERKNIDIAEIKALLYHLIDIIAFYELMDKTHSCNDCGLIDGCALAPDYGQQVRYNCMFWREKKGV